MLFTVTPLRIRALCEKVGPSRWPPGPPRGGALRARPSPPWKALKSGDALGFDLEGSEMQRRWEGELGLGKPEDMQELEALAAAAGKTQRL